MGFFSNCSKNIEEKKVDNYDSLISDAVVNYFSGKDSFITCYQNLGYFDTLKTHYKNAHNKRLWPGIAFDSSNLAHLREIIYYSQISGVNTFQYQSDLIEALLKKSSDTFKNQAAYYRNIAETDILISNLLLELHHANAFGQVNPKKLYSGHYWVPLNTNSDFYLMEILSPEFHKTFHRFDIIDPQLEQFKLILKEIRPLVFNKNRVSIPLTKEISPGDPTSIMPEILDRLSIFGFTEKIKIKKNDSFEYNPEHQKIIEKAHIGLLGNKNEKVKNDLINELNNPFEYMTHLMISMERIKWLKEFEKPFALINIPQFNLSLSGVDTSLELNTCVGKRKPSNYDALMDTFLKKKNYFLKPNNNETPQLASKIKTFVINPTWTLPYDIIAKEVFPKVLRDPGYLKRNGYKVYLNGKEVNPDSIAWKKFRPENLPFKIVQNPGMDNSLGRIKFLFPNPFSVYLHDTPLKGYFKYADRAVSHGCVRVENPIAFAEFLVKETETTHPDKIRMKLGFAPRDTINFKIKKDTSDIKKRVYNQEFIILKKEVPVFIVYRTMGFDPRGTPLKFPDVYNKNDSLKKEMGLI